MVILGECEDANAIHRWSRFRDEMTLDFYGNHFNLDYDDLLILGFKF